MGVEPPTKYMNRELNSQIDIRSQDSHFSESDGAPPTSMLLWGAAYYVRYVKHDANDSLCTTWFAVAAGCGTAALAVTAQIRQRHHTSCDTYKDIHSSTIVSQATS